MSEAPLHPLERDWYGEAVPGSPRWSLALEGTDLVLRGEVDAAPLRVPGDREGRFLEGLWEGDVVEAFLLNPATGYYLELNLAPGGAWWACGHEAPRVRTESGGSLLEGVRTSSLVGPEGWSAALRIPLAALPRGLAFDPAITRGNVTFCLGRPRRYLSVADLGGGTPDFHRPERWIPLAELLDQR